MDNICIRPERGVGIVRVFHRGSFTIEAVIWIPIMVFLLSAIIKLGINFYLESENRTSYSGLLQLDIVQEFYNYQVLEEIGKELLDD